MHDCRRFQSQWALGIPVVVRNIHRKFDWTPECMMRATRDVRAARNAGKLVCLSFQGVTCLDCTIPLDGVIGQGSNIRIYPDK